MKKNDTNTKHKNIFSKGYTENWSRKTFIIHSVLKTNPCTYKVKVDTSDLTVKKILLLWKLKLTNY